MPPPILTRTTTLAVAAWSTGIRLFSQTDYGDIREGCCDGDQTVDQFDRHWYMGTCHAAALPGSSLAAIAWDEGNRIQLFYQKHDHSISELFCEQEQWTPGPFRVDNALKGTDIQAINHLTKDGTERVHVYYQGVDLMIYEERFVDGQGWQQPEVVCAAAPHTSLAVVQWNSGQEIALFCQDATRTICEYSCAAHTGWMPRSTFKIKSQSSIAAAAYELDSFEYIRLYMQDTDTRIVELPYDKKNMDESTAGLFSAPALPNTDFAVVHRLVENQPFTWLYMAGPNGHLVEQICRGDRWEEPSTISTMPHSGDYFGGGEIETPAWNVDLSCAEKNVSKIVVGCAPDGSVIHSIRFEYTDGSKTFTGIEGTENLLHLPLLPGEDIIHLSGSGAEVEQTEDLELGPVPTHPAFISLYSAPAAPVPQPKTAAVLSALSFITSMGRVLPVTGTAANRAASSTFNWAPLGTMATNLLGVAGVAAPGGIAGLQPIRSQRDPQLDKMKKDAVALNKDAEELKKQAEKLDQIVPPFLPNLLNKLKTPFKEGLDALSTLVDAIEVLAAEETKHGSLEAQQKAIAKAKARSIAVKTCFDKVYAMQNTALKEAGNLDTTIVHYESQAETKGKEAADMLSVVTAMKRSAQQSMKQKKERLKVATDAIERAKATRAEAERKKDSYRKKRIVRDIFTLGLGEVGDWGGLNSAIESADRTIIACEADQQSAQESYNLAKNDLYGATQELSTMQSLMDTLSLSKGKMSSQRAAFGKDLSTMNGILKQAFDLGLVLGTLSAKSSPLPFTDTAAKLASDVVDLNHTLVGNKELKGVLFEKPGSLDDALKTIAKSDVEPNDMV